MEYISLKGTINSTIKVVNFTPYLVRFELKTPEQSYNCLVALDTFNFMYLAQEGAPISIFGHFNKRHQLIVDKYHVKNGIEILSAVR
ncbi:hypothetical protein K9848_03490 [Latilactobacillus sakei]|uniref:hypothetical protein n=1 Tax=Latilactobacillus sakei TaxID=1599 RepID=UPI0020C7B71E|nr:hypothetical protein [Latilactobacillus sakei]MCP8855253.1 hypothetical protein [Latilactobacillus sakei]